MQGSASQGFNKAPGFQGFQGFRVEGSRVSGFQTFRRSGFHGFKINRQSDICIQFQTGNFRKQVCLPRLQTASVCNQESDSTRKQPIIGQPPPAALKSDSRARACARVRAHISDRRRNFQTGNLRKHVCQSRLRTAPVCNQKSGSPQKQPNIKQPPQAAQISDSRTQFKKTGVPAKTPDSTRLQSKIGQPP